MLRNSLSIALRRWPSESPTAMLIAPRQRRHLVTTSINPPMQLDKGCVERTFTVALIDSSLYGGSEPWLGRFASALPCRGIHFLAIDVLASLSLGEDKGEGDQTLPLSAKDSFERMHAGLAADLAPYPEVVVVARGAIPSLVAQYYVESIALSALVLVDPFLLPRRVLEEATKEENEVAGATLQESAAWVLDNLESPDRCGKAELQLLEELTRGAYDRPLRLEPGSVQTHVMYTGGSHTCEAHHRKVAELVAGRHADDSGGSYRGRVEARALASEGEAVDLIEQWCNDVL